MATKDITITIEVSETLAQFVEAFAALNKIPVNEAYAELLNSGICEMANNGSSGTPDFNKAILQGALKASETVRELAKFNNLTAIANQPLKPTSEVVESLAPNVEQTRAKARIDRITNEVLNCSPKKQ